MLHENSMTSADVKQILDRLEKLEKAVFKIKSSKPESEIEESFSGISGGIRLLMSQGFLSKKRSLSDIRTELGKHDYHSSIQAVQTNLNRFSKTGGPLIALKEAGRKMYAKRK